MSYPFGTGTENMAVAGANARGEVSGGTGNRCRFPRRSRRGATLFGVILGVAVSALFLLGLVSAYQGVVTSTRTQGTLGTLSTIETTVRRTFANRPEFEGAGALKGIARSAVPSNAIQGTGGDRVIVTPWGGPITVGAGTDPSADTASPNRFFISIAELPEAACEAIAAAYLDRADVIGVDAANNGTALSAITGPVDDTAVLIDAGCDGSDDDAVAIVFRG